MPVLAAGPTVLLINHLGNRSLLGRSWEPQWGSLVSPASAYETVLLIPRTHVAWQAMRGAVVGLCHLA